MKFTFRAVRPAFALALATLVLGCSSPPPPPPPTVLDLTFSASSDVNPDPAGRASPIIVRYYQLASPNSFLKGDYFQIHDNEAALLGPDLLGRDEVPLLPGASSEVKFEPKKDAKFLGAIASYRDIDSAVWRATTPIPPNKTTKIKVLVEKLKLSLVPEAK